MKAKIFFAIIFLFVLITNPVNSCTTFTINTGDELVFGKNYDWLIGDGIVFVNKNGVVKKAFTEKNIPVEWVSKYGSVTFNQYGREFPSGGINEAGLVIELMWLDETKYPDKDERPATGGILQWIQYQLDNCETIQEVIDTDKLIRIPSGSVPVHYLVSDSYGNSASIEFLDGKLVQHSGEAMKYKVLTNDSYENSMNYLKTLREFGGASDIKGENSSFERFAKSCSMINNYKKESDRTAVDYGFEILNSVKQGDHTKWSIVYDIKKMKVYFKTLGSDKIKNIDLSRLDFNCSSPVQMIDINSGLEGNVNAQLTDYTYEANRKLIEDAYSGVDFLKDATDIEKNKTASYPEKLNCRSKSGIDINKTEQISKVVKSYLQSYLFQATTDQTTLTYRNFFIRYSNIEWLQI
ncbi:MAG: linear amide C-N hydrolase [bacterium]